MVGNQNHQKHLYEDFVMKIFSLKFVMGWLPFSVHFELEEEGAKTAHCFARISFRFERRPIVIEHVFCLSLISQMDDKWRQQQLGVGDDVDDFCFRRPSVDASKTQWCDSK